MPAVLIRDLSKHFGTHEVLHGIDLTIEKGEVVAIIGPSGSGKTTLLRCINLLERPTGGLLEIDGRLLVRPSRGGGVNYARPREVRAVRMHVGMVFQRFNLFPHLTALQNVMEGPLTVLHRPRRECEEKARKLLAEVDLTDKAGHYPAQLSGGQQQRVAIARALAMDPHLILFDEVTSAVDPEMVGEILLVIRRLAEESMTMLVVTHEIGFAGEIANRVVFMDKGTIAEEGPARALLSRPQKQRTRAFLKAIVERVPLDDEGPATIHQSTHTARAIDTMSL